MKYPQLVSARAVNAISDWLISRLEDLGVDAPVVYSRLLLSLLHTPLQVNALDLAEIPQLKGWFARKNRRLTQSDAEALKKFAAVESLMEVAESDQQKSNVEDLVNELCKRLREIENNSSDYEESVEMEAKTINESTTKAEDPTKRYYRAFPALSNRQFGEEGGGAAETSAISSGMPMNQHWPNEMGSVEGVGDEGQGGATCDDDGGVSGRANNGAAGVKRKTKRRRNNGLGKGKSSSFTRRTSTGSNTKTSLWDTDFSGNWEMGHDMIRDFIIKQNNRNRSISESDASKFVKIMQSPDIKIGGGCQSHKGGGCTDEAFKLPLGVTVNEEQTMLIKNMLQSANVGDTFRKETSFDAPNDAFMPERADMSPFFASFDTQTLLFGNNMIRDEGYATPDTLTSTSEVESTSAAPPRRLYEREVSNESLNMCPQEVTKGDDEKIAKFEAKFNKSVEALWGHDFWHKYYGNQYNDDGTPKKQTAIKAPTKKSPPVVATTPIVVDASGSKQGIVFNSSGWPTKNPSLTDMMAANKDSTTDLNAIWAAPQQPEPPSCSQLFTGRTVDSTWAPKNFDKANTLPKFLPEPSVMGYPLSDFIGLSKWSDQPFTCDDENRREFDECKSLPIVSYANYAFATAPQQEDEEVRVTLMNHSKDSHFATVKKSSTRTTYNKQKGYKGYAAAATAAATASATTAENTENLLTSDRTHFRPIKQTFVDGFIFDIPCTPDNIRYERTDTGSMYFDSERYMEYLAREDADEVDGMQKGGNFRLKFCVRQIEKYSQTEDRLLYLSGRMFAEADTAVRDDSDVDMTPDIFSYDNECDDLDLFRQSTYTGSYQGTDCYGSECLDIDNWTMAEMKKNCVENNNSHTLWGHCAACNNSTMSLPANRLLRDELYADGEEILSDLRDMQDLYIGEDGDESEWADEVFEDVAGPQDGKEMYYYNVNKLISDLLRPETVKQLTQVLGEKNQKTIMEGIMSDEGASVWRTWSEWKENEVMARDEISYNISDEHLRCLMREKRRPDRKRRHSASQNLPEDSMRSKFHGNPMLRDAWDAYEHHEALIELPTKSTLNSSSILSRVTVTSRPLTR